jgi:hypothetical protein
MPFFIRTIAYRKEFGDPRDTIICHLAHPEETKEGIEEIFFYQAQNPDELSIVESEQLDVVGEGDGDGWLKARNYRGEEGFVPQNYLDVEREPENNTGGLSSQGPSLVQQISFSSVDYTIDDHDAVDPDATLQSAIPEAVVQNHIGGTSSYHLSVIIISISYKKIRTHLRDRENGQVYNNRSCFRRVVVASFGQFSSRPRNDIIFISKFGRDISKEMISEFLDDSKGRCDAPYIKFSYD